MADLHLRVLSVDDWQIWRELRLAALADAPAAFGSTLAEWSGDGDTESRWRARLEMDGAHDVIGSIDGVAVGMLTISPDTDSPLRAWLMSMWVAPSSRRRGIAGVLIDNAIEWARREKKHSVNLMVRQGNTSAINLYARYGFALTGATEVEQDSNGVEWTEVHMARALS
jgi:ribosomal protein S18 acetylase RimI-like enzyme